MRGRGSKNYVQRHGAGFRFQMAVPADMRAVVGRKVWRRYLGDVSPAEARILALRLAAKLHEHILEFRSGITVGAAGILRAHPEPNIVVSDSDQVEPESKIDAYELVRIWQLSRHPKSRRTISRMNYCAKALLGNRTIYEITKTDIIRFREELESRSLSQGTLKSYWDALRTLFSVARSEGRIETNPMDGIFLRRRTKKFSEQNRKQAFNIEQTAMIIKMLDQEPVEFAWIVKILVFHGMRSGEVTQLRVDDFARLNGVAVIRIHDQFGSLKNSSAKRDIPLHPACYGIEAFLRSRSGDYVFSQDHWRSDRFQRYASLFLRTKVGISDRRHTMHSFRHSWRSLARELGMPSPISRAIMGHSLGRDVHESYGDSPSLKLMLEWLSKIEPLGTSQATTGSLSLRE